MKTRKILALGAVLSLLAVTAIAKVTFEWDEKADFYGYKSYVFDEEIPVIGVDGKPNPDAKHRIQAALARRLKEKGLNGVDDGADIKVVIHAAGYNTQMTRVTYRNSAFGPGQLNKNSKWTFPAASLTIDFVDVKRDELIWRARASEFVLAEKTEKNLKKLDKILDKAFKKYPPYKRAEEAEGK